MKFLAALLFASTGALAIPNEITAEYQVMNSGVKIGRVNETFTRKGDDYFIQSVTRSEGPLKLIFDDQVTLESTGKVVGGGLRPLRFEQKRARDSRRDVDATFDWERGVMRSTFRGESSEVALPSDTQDRLSLMYQLMRARAVEGTMKVPMANGRKVELYTYRLVREEKLTTPAGEFDTLHFERVTGKPTESRADVWLAKDRFNFPVRVVFDDPRGFRLDQILVALQTR